jgi:hypothetical protein
MEMNTYIAVFSLVLDDPKFTTGQVTAVVEADHVGAALDMFRALMLDAKRREALFYPVKRVFLSCCTELPAIPAGGVMTYMQLADNEGFSINTSNVQRLDTITSFGYGPADSTDEDPFVEFE